MKAIERRIESLEEASPAVAGAGFIEARRGQTADEAWREQYGDEPRPTVLFVLRGLSEGRDRRRI